jgi:alpha-1,2-mannosyltransferase
MGRFPGPPVRGGTSRAAVARAPLPLAVGLVGAVACLLLGLLAHPLWRGLFDLRVYRGAVRWWASGEPLYTFQLGHSGYGFTYPPFAAVALSPLAVVSAPVAAVVLTAASVAVVVVTTWRFLAPVARRAGWPPVLAAALAVPTVLLMDPVRETIAYGQVNLLLVALVLADVVAVRHGRRWAGVGTGLAAAVKLTPAIFVLYLVLTRRWRAAGVAVATATAATATAYLVSPHTSVQFWTATLWETSRIGHVDKTSNQSLLGLLARVAGPTPPRALWALLALAVLVLGLWRAARAHAQGDELVGLVLTGLTACLISPISWTHHLYWLVPAVIVLLDVALGRPVGRLRPWPGRLVRRSAPLAGLAGLAAVGITAACCSSVIWFFQRHSGLVHAGSVLGAVGENAFVLVMVLLVALLPARASVPASRPPAGDDATALAAD